MVSYNHHQPGISVTELHKNFPLTFSDKMEKAPVSKYLRNIVIKFFYICIVHCIDAQTLSNSVLQTKCPKELLN